MLSTTWLVATLALRRLWLSKTSLRTTSRLTVEAILDGAVDKVKDLSTHKVNALNEKMTVFLSETS